MKKVNTWKKVVAGVALCSMAASMASAIKWAPVNTPAYWDDTANWDLGALPGADEKTQFSSDIETECIVRYTNACGQLVLGDGGNAAQTVNMRIVDGGVLNAKLAGGSWVGVGYNRNAHCTVEAGGEINSGTRIGVGMIGGVGLLEVYGDITAAGVLQVGNGGGDGTVMIYDGATVSATGLEMRNAEPNHPSLIDLWASGEMVLSGDLTNTVASRIADGKIIGNRLTNNVDYALVVDAGVTNTVVTATPSIPNLEGLSLTETTNMLAQFDYVVGNITVGYVSGALTDHVIGQSPVAGSAPIASNSPIDLVIQETSIPNIVGLTLVEASNTLVSVGLTLGSVSNSYVFDAPPTEVLEQDPPAGGSAAAGDPVNVVIMEPRPAAQTDIVSVGTGNWMDLAIWSPNVVPERETQEFKVKGLNDSVITLTNRVAAKTLVLGDGGSCQLDIMDGGHFVGGQFGDWCAIGYSASVTLNVYTGGVFEARKNVLYGWQNATSYMNIDGGSVVIGDWVSLGRNDGSSSSETVIKNGGSMICLRFRNDMTNGVITVYDGTFAMHGTGRINDIQNGLDAGTIKVAPGYSYTLSNETGDSVLTGFKPDYNAWAGTWGVDIGSETNDYDGDLANNFWEYGANGDPTNSANTGVDPVLLSSGGGLDYVHLSRADNTNLQYIVETTDDLVLGSWTNLGYVVAGTGTATNDYYAVTNSIDTAAAKKFIRLKIVNP